MECQTLFCGENKKKYFNMSCVENFTQSTKVCGDEKWFSAEAQINKL